MPMVKTSKTTRAGYFLVGGPAAAGHHALEMATVLSGRNLPAGAVVGKVTVSGKLVYWNPGAADGSQNVHGLLFDDTDATSGDLRQAVLVRDCEVNFAELSWHPDAVAGDKATARVALAALGIACRDAIPA